MSDNKFVRAVTLDRLADVVNDIKGVDVRHLPPFTTLLVRTVNSLYRVVITQQPEVFVQGGVFFPDPTSAYLDGASMGEFRQVGWIGVGLLMQIRWGDRRHLSPPPSAPSPPSRRRDRSCISPLMFRMAAAFTSVSARDGPHQDRSTRPRPVSTVWSSSATPSGRPPRVRAPRGSTTRSAGHARDTSRRRSRWPTSARETRSVAPSGKRRHVPPASAHLAQTFPVLPPGLIPGHSGHAQEYLPAGSRNRCAEDHTRYGKQGCARHDLTNEADHDG